MFKYLNNIFSSIKSHLKNNRKNIKFILSDSSSEEEEFQLRKNEFKKIEQNKVEKNTKSSPPSVSPKNYRYYIWCLILT